MSISQNAIPLSTNPYFWKQSHASLEFESIWAVNCLCHAEERCRISHWKDEWCRVSWVKVWIKGTSCLKDFKALRLSWVAGFGSGWEFELSTWKWPPISQSSIPNLSASVDIFGSLGFLSTLLLGMDSRHLSSSRLSISHSLLLAL